MSIVLNVGLLFLFKYLNFFVTQINNYCDTNFVIRDIPLPIGISFFTFQALSYVIDVYRGERCQKNLFYVGLYISFFPQLIAGPIVRYNSIERQIEDRIETIDDFKYGILRFVQGFVKKVLLANTLAIIVDKAFAIIGKELTVSFAWLGAISYTLQIFFDFSGYSDMAIGLGKMFEFTFEENFNYPYISSSITEFWRRWHISLSSWFKDYVYIPLGGSRTNSVLHDYFNLFIVWLLTGIWHGANWTFIVWGLLYFLFLIIEKATPYGKLIANYRIIGHIYTLCIVTILWVIFRSNSISQAMMYIKTMMGMTSANLYQRQTSIYIKENFVYLLFAIILSSNVYVKTKNIIYSITNDKRFYQVYLNLIAEVTIMILFFVAIVYIINGTYNPFIYFHF